jgi:phosphohistidine phosphatase SixA
VAIGEALRRLAVPIGRVLASPYCRTLETARLAFGEAEAAPDLVSELSLRSPDSPDQLAAALRTLLATTPEPGTNTVLVTHVLNIETAIGLDPDEGEAVVVKPDGAGSFAILKQVPAAGWDALGP